jgi:kumamolisin
MKFLSLTSAAAAVLISGSQAGAVTQTNSIMAGAQIIPHKTNTIVVPSSSFERPEDKGINAHTNIRFVVPNTPLVRAAVSPNLPPYAGYGYETPASLACIHGLVTPVNGCNPNSVTAVAKGGSRAIAIVDAYHYPAALADLQAFSKQFGLPVPTTSSFQTVYANGVQPARDLGWELEEALDIEYAHAMAPNATLYLVEAASSSDNDLLSAITKASQLVAQAGGGEISMSWGGAEFTGQTSLDSYFSKPNVVYFASSGDSPGTSWPATSANVVAVGGASISRSMATLNFLHLSSWSEAGSGVSGYVPRPSYQAGIASLVGTMRGVPDIAADANPETGAWVLDSGNGGWYIVGGTSLSSPTMAGITNASNSFAASSNAELTKIYSKKAANPAAFGSPVTGYCGVYTAYTVSASWNFCTGVGAPISLTTQ